MATFGLTLLLTAITSSTTTAEREIPRMPLSVEDLQLLQNAEGENNLRSSTSSRAEKSKQQTVPRALKIRAVRRGMKLGEDLAQTLLPLAFQRNGPGDLSPVYQNRKGRRLRPRIDGVRIHHLFDPFDESARLNLFESQNLDSAHLDAQGLSLTRKNARYSNHRAPRLYRDQVSRQAWLQGGSLLRDYQFGLGLEERQVDQAWSSQIAISRPSTGYFAIGQASKRRNASFRGILNDVGASDLQWSIGADFDQLLDVVRWDLNAQGQVLDRSLERLSLFSGLRWENETAFADLRLIVIRNQAAREQAASSRTGFQQSSLQSGIEFKSLFRLGENIAVGPLSSYELEQGQRQTPLHLFRGQETQLSAGLHTRLAWGEVLSKAKKERSQRAGQLSLFVERVWQSRVLDQARYDASHWRVRALFVQHFMDKLYWKTQAIHRKDLPQVGDLLAGADAGLETQWSIDGGPSVNVQRFSLRLAGFVQGLTNPRIRSFSGDEIVRGQNQEGLGMRLELHFSLTDALGFDSVTTWQRSQATALDHYFGRYQIHYLYAPRQLYFELSLNQYALDQYALGSHFRMPLGDSLSAQITVNNIFDFTSLRPQSMIPEPELNVRAIIRAAW